MLCVVRMLQRKNTCVRSHLVHRDEYRDCYGLNLLLNWCLVNEAELYGIDYQYVDYEDWPKSAFMPRKPSHDYDWFIMLRESSSDQGWFVLTDQLVYYICYLWQYRKKSVIDRLKVSDFLLSVLINQNFIEQRD